MKKNKYDKEDKKYKILQILKWIFVGLGWSLLCAAFVGLLCLGIKGCTNKKSNNNPTKINSDLINEPLMAFGVNDTYNDYYYIGGNRLSVQDMDGLESENVEEYRGLLGDNSYFTINGLNQPINEVVCGIEPQVQYYIYFNYDNTRVCSWYFDLDIEVASGDLVAYQCGFTFENNPSTWDSDLYTLFRPFMYRCLQQYEGDVINFNNVINPFGVMGQPFDYFQLGDYTGTYSVFKGLFITIQDGTLYNEITITYLGATASRFGTADEYNTAPSGNYQYMSMQYVKASNNQAVVVNSQDYVKATSGSAIGQPVLVKSNTWLSSIFQNIRILVSDSSSGSTLPTKNYTRLQVLTSFNNIGDTSGLIMGGYNGENPFTLLSGAFKGIASILGINVIPGIALGVFIFIPLTITIILYVVHLFKR